MIRVDTETGRSMYDNRKLHSNVMISVPYELKSYSKEVLTHELCEILKTLDKIDPSIIYGAIDILIKEIDYE